MKYFTSLSCVRFLQSLKRGDKAELDNVISNSSTDMFKGMIPIINSAILQSDKFQKSQHKNSILFGMMIVNNMLFSFILGIIVGNIAGLICGDFVGIAVNKMVYTATISLTSVFFIISFLCHKFCEHNVLNIGGSEQQINSTPFHSALQDLSVIHGVGTLFIPCLVGNISDSVVKKCRKMLGYTENEFNLRGNDQWITTSLSSVLIKPSANRAIEA